jgi:integrase
MASTTLVDIAGRRRSAATLPGYHHGRPPRNKGLQYPADPPTVEEIIAVMRAAGDDADGARLRGLIIVLWRAGLRISEALALTESDLDAARGAVLIRCGKGGKRREVGMDQWAWSHLEPWLEVRRTLPVGGSSASCVGRHAAGRARRRASANSCTRSRSRPESVAGSRRISCGTRTRLRCARGDFADRDPAPTRQPRDHLRVPARHRQHRDRAHRPRTTRAHNFRP